MPQLRILTNQTLSDTTFEKISVAATKLLSEHLAKPESKFMIVLQDGLRMKFAGTQEPIAYLHLESIGFQEAPSDLAPVLCAFVEEHLGIPSDRTYVHFEDLDPTMYAWNGSTFQ